MSKACPLCNGLVSVKNFCCCGAAMEDSGPVSDYYGPYSPYYKAGDPSVACIHLFTCPDCGQDIRELIDMVEL